ncbi:hypothetical protein VPH35_053080 [Triticum aestivum]
MQATLRVIQSLPSPPLSLALSGGSAARREDGLSGWLPLVHSSISIARSRSCFASAASGDMPLSCSPPARASRARWSPAASSTCCPWRTEATGGGSGASFPSRTSSCSPLIWRKPSCRRSLLQAAAVVGEGGRRRRLLHSADRVRAHQRRTLWWSYDAGRLPVFIFLSLLQAKGRPTFFLPACVPNGRQIQLLLGGHGGQEMRPWRLRRPKWFVPGGGDVGSEQKLEKDPIAFLFSIWGPPCKSQGLSCLCYVSYGSLGKMYCRTAIVMQY